MGLPAVMVIVAGVVPTEVAIANVRRCGLDTCHTSLAPGRSVHSTCRTLAVCRGPQVRQQKTDYERYRCNNNT
jgi:hypothetical protein